MTVSCVYIMHFDHTHPPPYSLPRLADSFLNSVFVIVGTKSHFCGLGPGWHGTYYVVVLANFMSV